MAAPVGTTYGLFKSKFMLALQAVSELSTVSRQYNSPVSGADLVGSTGLYEHICYADAEFKEPADGDQENVIICGLPVNIEEDFEVPVMIQVILNEQGTQEEADARLDQIFYYVMKTIAANPGMGIKSADHPEVVYFKATYCNFTRKSGIIDTGRGSGMILNIQCKARINYSVA